VFDPDSEDAFPLAEVCRRLKSQPSVQTVWRWAMKGVRGVQLESRLIGGRRYTSREAVDRFLARLSQPGPAALPPITTRRAEQQALAAARAAATF